MLADRRELAVRRQVRRRAGGLPSEEAPPLLAVVRKLRKRLATECRVKWSQEQKSGIFAAIMGAAAAALHQCYQLHASHRNSEACLKVTDRPPPHKAPGDDPARFGALSGVAKRLPCIRCMASQSERMFV